AIRTALDLPEPTMMSVLDILDGQKRTHATDPMDRRYWDRLEHRDARYQDEARDPAFSRLDTLLSSPATRAVLCQPPTFDLSRVLRDGKILIANLNVGKIGAINGHLIGAFLVSGIIQAAFSGATSSWDNSSQQFHQRRFYLFVDEWQHFATQTFATALS